MSEERWLEDFSLAIADGQTPDNSGRVGDDSDEARAAARLLELATLRSVFQSRMAGAEADEPLCPFDWGRLEVLEVIGQGSFARVYRAHDPVLDRDVALKLFRHDRQDLDAGQLIAEARRHARVHHPRVLAVHGADVDDGIAGLWTDLLEGETLADHVASGRRLAGDALRALATDLAAGLAAVHEQGIVHGDLKPANVWIDKGERAILMDFGAASPSDADDPARYGSPVTMGPELFAGQPPSPASDAWALGAVLQFAATGRYPFTGTSILEIQAAHERGDPPDLADLRRAAPEEAPVVGRLLARTPGDRATLDQVALAISDLEAAPQRRFRRRAVGALVISLVVGLAVALVLLDRSETARDAEAQARLAAEQAQQESEAAREGAERARFEAQTSKEFLIQSVQAMSPEAERGLGTVRAVLDFLDEFSDERLAETPLALGEMKVVVGTRLTHFDEIDRGLALAEAGIATIEATAPAARDILGNAYYALAEAQRQAGRYEPALINGEQAIALLEQLEQTDERRYEIIQIRGMLVGIHGDLGNWRDELVLQRAQIAERAALVGEDDPRMAVEYNNLAQAEMANGHNAEALEAFSRAMSLLEAGETRRLFPEALVTHSIAVVLLRLGRPEEAAITLEDARARFLALGSEPDDERFRRLDRVEAGILRRQGRLDDALAILERQADLEVFPLQQRYNHLFYGTALLEAGRGAEAHDQLRQARAAYAWREGHPERIYLDGALAYAEAAAAGRPADATAVVGESLAFFESMGYGGSDMARDLRTWAAAIAADG
ncbi:MAG: serine/threonine-protein kinase [Pseudomonadota bacterium]